MDSAAEFDSMNFTLADNILKIGSAHIWAYVFAGAGLLIIIAGGLMFKKFPKHFRFHLPVGGILFLMLSYASVFYDHKTEILIDDNEDVIMVKERNYGNEQIQSSFPFDNFTHVEIMKHIPIGNTSNVFDVADFTVRVARRNHLNDPIELGNFTESEDEELYDFIYAIRNTMQIPVFIVAPAKIVQKDPFIKQFHNEMNIEVKYAIPVAPPIDTTEIKVTKADHKLPESSNMEIVDDGDEHYIKWHNRKSPFLAFEVGLSIILAFTFIQQILVPRKGFALRVVIPYLILSVVGIVWAGIMLASVFSYSYLTFEGNNIKYSTKLFGMTAFENNITKSDVNLIVNTFNSDRDGHIEILTNNGLVSLIQKFETGNIGSDPQEQTDDNSKHENFELSVNVSSLTVSERMVFVEEIRKFVRE